ncbi:MAG: nitroreductase [Mogibacterium sp.]|nr:nitroreductase [Mogibacterium sp.]MBR0340839.1 nitroreductase [Oscillospiraceae bacterium]
MDALDAIKTRRSTRIMAPEIPARELLDQIIESGRLAPSGSNSQSTHFIVITNKALLTEIAGIVMAEFAKMEVIEDTYISLKNSILMSKKGQYAFHYMAPVLIVTANKKDYGNAIADSACALENMMIAANALDLGSCWINQLHWLDESEGVRAFMEKLGLGADETITGGLIVGYPANGELQREPLPRKGNPVTWVE